MRKTMVYLEEEQFWKLKRRARAEGRSLAELVREAVARYLRPRPNGKDVFDFVGAGRGPKGEAASEQSEEFLKEILKGPSRP